MMKTMGAKEPRGEVAVAPAEGDDDEDERRDDGIFTISPRAAASGEEEAVAAMLLPRFREGDSALPAAPPCSCASTGRGLTRLLRV